MTADKSYGKLRLWTHSQPAEELTAFGEPDHEQHIDSYLAQWGDHLASQMGAQGVTAVTDTSGADRTLVSEVDLVVEISAGPTDEGTVIGTGGGTESITDFQLASKITADFDYGGSTVSEASVSGNVVVLDVTRTFTNTSGSDIDVSEVGLETRSEIVAGGFESFLLVRDVLGSPTTVADGDNVTVEYALEFQV